MLDAKERATEFWSTTADDITMRQTAKNLHSCTAYEESRLRTVQRIQGNFTGKCYVILLEILDIFFSRNNQSVIDMKRNKLTNKYLIQVSTLLFLLMFMFASYGVQLYGGRLARCNDPTILKREECVGVFMRRVFVTKMKLRPGENESYPSILVPRVW